MHLLARTTYKQPSQQKQKMAFGMMLGRHLLLAAAMLSCIVSLAAGKKIVPCKADGSSLECDCCNQTNGPFIVNCGFLREYIPGDFRADPKPMITTVSEAKINNEKLAAKVDELYLYNNSLTRFGGQGDLVFFTGLKVLNLRYNDITMLQRSQFKFQTKLEELILEDNQITELQKDAFQYLGNLELLRLGGNKLTRLPAELFAGTVKLKILRLENNGLTALEPTLFNFQEGCTSCLEELHLQRNALTELPEFIFAPLKGLKRLFLQVNPLLKLIPEAVFKTGQPMTNSLEKMSMLGSASACVLGSNVANVQCTCAVGYADGTTDRTGAYCTPVVCPPKIADIDGLADSDCGVGKEYLSTCVATCKAGYAGEQTYTCQPKAAAGEQEGEWVADTPVQCEAKTCAGPPLIPIMSFGLNTVHTQGAATCSGDQLKYGGPACIVPCKKGYAPKEGTSTAFTCGVDQKWKGDLVCESLNCGPKITQLKEGRFEYISMDGLDTVQDRCTGRSGETGYGEECRVQCAKGYRVYATEADTGKPKKVDFKCGENQLWEGDIDCRGERCGRNGLGDNPDPNVVARCLGDVTYGGDKCGISCKNGYTPKGALSRVAKDYCQIYQQECLGEFQAEFGNGGDSLNLCYFRAERSTIGDFPLTAVNQRSQNTIACRISYIYNENENFQKDCTGARLSNNAQCSERVCPDGSVECLPCGKYGNWKESKLTCKPVECPAEFDAIKVSACDDASIYTEKDRRACMDKFQALADLASGTNCDGANEFGNVCPISCKHGYSPKNSSFLCDADQLAIGVWVGELDCNPVQCPVDIKEIADDYTVYLKSIDPDARVQTIVQDISCPTTNARFQILPLAGAAGAAQSSAGVVKSGECVEIAQYDPTNPTEITVECTGGEGTTGVTETYKLACDDPSWLVTEVLSGPLKDSGRELFDWQKGDGSRFCRRNCGEYLGFSVEKDDSPGSCEGYAEGDNCIGICKFNREYSVILVCDWETQSWIADPTKNYDPNDPTKLYTQGNLCENLLSTTSTTRIAADVQASGKLSAGAQAAVIVIPLIILTTALFVVLYYFGYLKMFGLQPTQPKHEVYGQIYGDIYGAMGGDIYAAAVESRKKNKQIAKQKNKKKKADNSSAAAVESRKKNKQIAKQKNKKKNADNPSAERSGGQKKAAQKKRKNPENGTVEMNPMFAQRAAVHRVRGYSGSGGTASTAFA